MEYEDQLCLGLFLIELQGHREKLLKDNSTATQAHPQRTITTFLAPSRLIYLYLYLYLLSNIYCIFLAVLKDETTLKM